VPSSALVRENGRYALYRVVDGSARKNFVDIGLRGASATQIRSGLKPGDVVVAHPDDRIADGVRVTAATP
jgi:HlyD family secretion protein